MGDEPNVNEYAAHLTVLAAENAVNSLSSAATSLAGGVERLFRSSLKDYLDQTFSRVSKFKTFLKPHQPIDLAENFISMSVKCGEDKFDESGLIERLSKSGKIVITAPAGRGKSILMRYLALAKYNAPEGSIPLFIELRQLNSITSKDLITFIWSDYGAAKTLTLRKFKSELEKGIFTLILDGFDEVNPEYRGEIERNILDISKDYPEAPIIVSGRPDDVFKSWPQFMLANVLPMTKLQVIALIEGLDYDKGPKQKFLRSIKSGLYEAQESFLSTPLLAILMLMTFEQFAEIPNKIHIFYDNAFETLFRRHDATKSQFLRKTRSGLAIDSFRTLFSAFCALSYVKNDFSFNREKISEYMAKAIKYSDLDCTVDDVLADLIESLCVMQIDGFEYTFVHRSFQEYFCAVFISRSSPDVRKKFISSIISRFSDSVIPMAYEMAPNLVEVDWTAPTIEAILAERRASEYSPLIEFDKKIGTLSYILMEKNVKFAIYQESKYYFEIMSINNMYREIFEEHDVPSYEKQITSFHENLNPVIKKLVRSNNPRFLPMPESKSKSIDFRDKYSGIVMVELTHKDLDILSQLGVTKRSNNECRALEIVLGRINSKRQTRDVVIDEIFQ